jgi:hypothetical protein
MCSDMSMHNLKVLTALGVVVVSAGAALAQMEASSASTYFLDVDSGRYTSPGAKRLAVLVGDEPRHVQLSSQDEICVQLQRPEKNSQVISARVRVLRPEPHELAEVRVAGPDLSPGTFRTTPWGLLLRVLPAKADGAPIEPALGTNGSPVCVL